MAKKNPSTRWFFKDWENDEALRLCSLAAQGLWMRLLCICAANDGYLLINGKPPSGAALARYIGEMPAVVRRLVQELDDAGVFSRTSETIIFNRRMVRANGNGGNDANDSDDFAHARTRDHTRTHAHAHITRNYA